MWKAQRLCICCRYLEGVKWLATLSRPGEIDEEECLKLYHRLPINSIDIVSVNSILLTTAFSQTLCSVKAALQDCSGFIKTVEPWT
jgi:hypothetical protein